MPSPDPQNGYAMKHHLTGKWWLNRADLGATEPAGPFDTKEEAEAYGRK